MKTLVASAIFLAVAGQSDPRWQRTWDAAQQQRPARLDSVARIAAPREPGTPLTITGQVLDLNGRPAPDVEVFAYHTDGRGLYAAPGAADAWRLKGWARTDVQGRFEFHTVKPGPYPGRDVPAHIHAAFITSCCGREFADLMFDDDPLATPAYRDRFARAGEHGYYGKLQKAGAGESVSYTIRLRGRGDF